MRALLRVAYRIALVAFPRDFRRRFGLSMCEAFDASLQDRGVGFGLRAVLETAGHGIRERVARVAARRRRAVHRGAGERGSARDRSRWEPGVLVRETRLALRAFRRSPTLSICAVAILTVGIGATTAVFTVVDALILRSVPFPDSDRLVAITETYQPENGPVEVRSVSYPDFVDWRDNTSAFQEIGIRDFQNVSLRTSDAPPVLVGAEFLSPALLRSLGIRPVLGRLLVDEDDRRGNLVGLIGHDLWRTHFGADSAILGARITVNERTVTVVGVADASFDGTYGGVSLWVPFLAQGELIASRPFERVQLRGVRGFGVVGRLAPGVALADAQRQLDGVSAGLHAAGVLSTTRGARVQSFEEFVLGSARDLALVLALAVGLVLVIACANVANLLLARQLGRMKEMALRRALGAGTSTLVRQMLVESTVLGIAGGAGGAALATWLTQIVGATVVGSVPNYIVPAVDAVALLFAVVVSLATGIVFGIVPALHVRKASIGEALKTAPRTDAGGGSGGLKTRRALVVGQIVVAMPLLVGSALMMRGIGDALATDPGFEPNGVGVASVGLPQARYDAVERLAFAQQLLNNLELHAQVTRATIASDIPLNSGYSARNVRLSDPNWTDQNHRVYQHWISPGYFATLGIPVLEGRTITASDRMESQPIIVISKAMADRFWAGESPLGQLVDSAIVVGVVGNARYRSLLPNQAAFPDDPDIFHPLSRSPPTQLQVAVRGELPDGELTGIIRREVLAIDPALTVYGETSLSELVEAQVSGRRAATEQIGAFATIALLLAAGGLFGVMAYVVGRRSGEIGLRVALGATRRNILISVLGSGVFLIAIGIAMGTVASVGLVQLLEARLPDLPADGPSMYLSAGGAFVVMGVVACILPALKATRIDPLTALRSE